MKMRPGTVRMALVVVPSLVVSGVACSLVTDTSGLSSGGAAPRDAGGPDGSPEGSAADARADGPDAGRDPALVGEWLLEEKTGTTARDTSGHGHDGLVADATWIADGHAGGALQLGANGQVTIAGSPDFDRPANASFTMTAWVRPKGALDHDFPFSVSFGSTDACFGLETRADDEIDYYAGEVGDAGPGPAHIGTVKVPLARGTWSHIGVVVVNGTDTRLYFGGVRVSTGVADATPRTSTSVLLGTNNYGAHFPGAIDSLRFYRRALSDAEIAADRDR